MTVQARQTNLQLNGSKGQTGEDSNNEVVQELLQLVHQLLFFYNPAKDGVSRLVESLPNSFCYVMLLHIDQDFLTQLSNEWVCLNIYVY